MEVTMKEQLVAMNSELNYKTQISRFTRNDKKIDLQQKKALETRAFLYSPILNF
jgi:hypothetical protein